MSEKFSPESEMMGYGYDSKLAYGSIKPPIYQTSTFAFETAEQGKAFFQDAFINGSPNGMIYTRISHPGLELLEKRMALWESAEASAFFESGMSAISLSMLAVLSPGDSFLHSTPLYGGAHHFFYTILKRLQITPIPFHADNSLGEVLELVDKGGVLPKVIYVETPSNPTNLLTDFSWVCELKNALTLRGCTPLLYADNTYLGPIWQKPLLHGFDLSLYSATKYLGGHSDIIAGAALGSKSLIKTIKGMRTAMGGALSPFLASLLLRSLETLSLRMERQEKNAKELASFLKSLPQIEKICYLGDLEEGSKQANIYQKQCLGSGAMISLWLKGGEAEAFKFLNKLSLIKLAVSLGSTESLAQHPYTMTHSNVPENVKLSMEITPSLIRISVGIESIEDLKKDIINAF